MKALLRIVGAVLLLAVIAGAVFYWNPLWANDQVIRYHLWRSHVRSEYVEAGGYRIHYFEATPADGAVGIPLLLVHGLGSRAEDWSGMIPTLAAEGFHVYALDLLGYGRSARPDVAYSISLEESVVVEFMNAVGLQRADVDGWSMGGWIAAKLALDHPEMVDRLVLDDSAGLTYQIGFARDAFSPMDAAGLKRLMALLSPHPAAVSAVCCAGDAAEDRAQPEDCAAEHGVDAERKRLAGRAVERHSAADADCVGDGGQTDSHGGRGDDAPGHCGLGVRRSCAVVGTSHRVSVRSQCWRERFSS